MKVKPVFILFLFLVVFQQPLLTVDITLNKSFYQPGQTMVIDITIQNGTSVKECLSSLDVTISDPYKVFYSHTDSYPVDTECIEAGKEEMYTVSCDVPETVSEGAGTVAVVLTMWSGMEVIKTELFEIGINYPPHINVISYPSVVNPSQEYSIHFAVSDNFGVEDLESAEVVMYHEQKPSERERYTFTWERPNGYTVWEGTGITSVEASLNADEIVWKLRFSLSEIACPGLWTLDITVYDVNHQFHQVSEHFTVTKYLSFHIQTRAGAPSINFGKAEPGQTLPRVTLHLVVTSNASVTIFVQGGDLKSPEGNILPASLFYVEPISGKAVPLMNTRQVVYANYAGNRGYNQHTQIRLVFWGVLPEAVEAGAYSGVWYIIVEPD